MRAPVAALYRARRVLGVKGILLLLVSFVWSLQAYSIASGAGVAVTVPNEALFHLALPIWVRCTLWGGCAAVAAFCAVAHAPRLQGIGFAAAFLPPAERGLSYLGSWLVHVLTDGSSGVAGAWSQASSWLLVATFILLLAILREVRMEVPRD